MSQPNFETLLHNVIDGIATVTLNRLNAFTPGMLLDIFCSLRCDGR